MELTLEAKRVGYPANHEIHAAARQHVHSRRHLQPLEHPLVLLPHAADIDARAGGRRACQSMLAILQATEPLLLYPLLLDQPGKDLATKDAVSKDCNAYVGRV